MYQIVVYVPESHLEVVKQALFKAGAGRIGDYDSCAWQSKGEGQFRPLVGSKPYLGQRGQLESVIEYKVELVCQDELLHRAIAAMLEAHPYETPAYSVWSLWSPPISKS